MLPYQVHGTLLPPKECYILQTFRSNSECIPIPPTRHDMALPSLQPLIVHHNKEMVLSTKHEASLFTFCLVQMFSSTPDLTQPLPHMFRSCKDDPIFHGAGGFALIFLAEHARILFMSILFCIIFLGRDLYSFFFYVKHTVISFIFIWVRGTLPRFRYDKLMYLF